MARTNRRMAAIPRRNDRRAELLAQACTFVLAAKAKKGAKAGTLLADPDKMKTPPTTRSLAEAKTFADRTSSYKFFKRHPAMAKTFARQRVPLATASSAR